MRAAVCRNTLTEPVFAIVEEAGAGLGDDTPVGAGVNVAFPDLADVVGEKVNPV